AVVSLAGIPFGIFVGHDRALRLEHGSRDDVLRGNQLDFMALAPQFATNGREDVRIGFSERGSEKRLGKTGCCQCRCHIQCPFSRGCLRTSTIVLRAPMAPASTVHMAREVVYKADVICNSSTPSRP